MNAIIMPDSQIIAEKYQRDLTRLDLHIYNSSYDEDLLLLRLWMELIETGDIEKLVIQHDRRLTIFLQIFQKPTIAIYGLDTFGRIDFIIWFRDPSGQSIFCGLWANEKIRRSRRLFNIIRVVYPLAFEVYETIIGVTWQADILELHTKLGYSITGNLEKFMGQPTVWLVQLTKEAFYNSRLMQIGRK